MLQLLGYSRPSPQPTKPAIKSGDAQVAMAIALLFLHDAYRIPQILLLEAQINVILENAEIALILILDCLRKKGIETNPK